MPFPGELLRFLDCATRARRRNSPHRRSSRSCPNPRQRRYQLDDRGRRSLTVQRGQLPHGDRWQFSAR
jgi:hypothetical protein